MKRWGLLAREIYSGLESGKLELVFAPTSYGKTMASPCLYELAVNGNLASRLIHVVPVRALLREIYFEKFRPLSGPYLKVGYQSMDRLPGESKSPYFLSDIVVTTLDSFLWNIYKFPVAEISKILEGASEGHYYPTLAAITTSIVVFDEAHMYLGELEEEERGIAIASALKALRLLNVPTVLATATMSSGLVSRIVSALGLRENDIEITYACSRGCNKHSMTLEKLGFTVKYVEGLKGDIKWVTELINGSDNVFAKTVTEYCNDRVVLVVANTVDRVVKIYKELKSKCSDVALIHSRMTEEDKKRSYNAIRKVKNNKSGAIVASPIVEVGVEIDADILITDIAPLESLIQRAGRLCRGDRKCEDAKIIINVGASPKPYNSDSVRRAIEVLNNAINTGGCVEWRFFEHASCEPAIDLLERAAMTPSIVVSNLLTNYLTKDARPSTLLELDFIDEKLFRSLSLIKLVVDPQKCENSNDIVDCLANRSFAISIENLRWLERSNSCVVKCPKESVRLCLLVVKGDQCKIICDVCSQTLNRTIYVDKKLTPKSFRDLTDELKGKIGDNGKIVDFFVELRRECYKDGEGAYV